MGLTSCLVAGGVGGAELCTKVFATGGRTGSGGTSEIDFGCGASVGADAAGPLWLALSVEVEALSGIAGDGVKACVVVEA